MLLLQGLKKCNAIDHENGRKKKRLEVLYTHKFGRADRHYSSSLCIYLRSKDRQYCLHVI